METVGNEPILNPDNPIIDKPALDPVESSTALNSVSVEVIPDKITTVGKTKDITLNSRQAMMCSLISKGMKNGRAYAEAYNRKYEGSEPSCDSQASRMLSSYSKLRDEIERLCKLRSEAIVKNAPEKYAELFPESIDTLRDLLKPDQKGSVRLGAVREVKDVIIPKVSRHISMKVSVPADEYKRRRAIADKYRDV